MPSSKAKNPDSNAPDGYADTLFGQPVVFPTDPTAGLEIKAELKDGSKVFKDVKELEAAKKTAKDPLWGNPYTGTVDIDLMTFQDWQVLAQNPALWEKRHSFFQHSPTGKGVQDMVWLTQKVNLATYEGIFKQELIDAGLKEA